MRSSLRPNVKLILAAICIIAGVVILWRSFIRPPTSVVDIGMPTPTEMAEPSASLPNTPQPMVTDSAVPDTLNTPTQPVPTAIGGAVPPIPTALGETSQPAATALGETSQPAATALGETSQPAPTNVAASSPTVITPVVIVTQGLQPTAVGATSILATQAASNSPLAGTAVPISTLPVATITPLVSTITPLVTTITATPTSLATIQPTVTLTVATLTVTPSSTATPTVATLTPTATSATNALVVYRVEGAASKVVVLYLDETGNENTVEVTLPWTIQFTAALDADLAVDAFGTNNESVLLTCAIEINGSVLLTDQNENAINGVACERFVN